MLKSIINNIESNSHILKDINSIIAEDTNIVSKLEQLDANEQRILNGALKLKEEVERLSADISMCEELTSHNNGSSFVCPARQRLANILLSEERGLR